MGCLKKVVLKLTNWGGGLLILHGQICKQDWQELHICATFKDMVIIEEGYNYECSHCLL